MQNLIVIRPQDPGIAETTSARLESNPVSAPHLRSNLNYLQESLQDLWALGRNMVLNWSRLTDGIKILVVPYYLSSHLFDQGKSAIGTAPTDRSQKRVADATAHLLQGLMSGSREVSADRLVEISSFLKIDPVSLRFPYTGANNALQSAEIDAMIRRFSISYVHNRAVALIDIVGFSLLSAFEQTIQLNSLAYSINSAHNKLLLKGINVEFARSTTGDGYYIWNRVPDLEANINLYHLIHLVLADNAIARRHASNNTVPLLKTAFSLGDYYEFFETQGLRQTMYDYIVGEATIELARIIEKAQPGSFIMGSFSTQLPKAGPGDSESVDIDTVSFISQLQPTLDALHGIELSGEKIENILCYLTGDADEHNNFSTSCFRIIDKHGLARTVYNAKVNIYRDGGEPIFLGVQQGEIYSLEKIVKEDEKPRRGDQHRVDTEVTQKKPAAIPGKTNG